MIYLDSTSPTPISASVKKAIVRLLDTFMPLTSIHLKNPALFEEVNAALEILYEALGADSSYGLALTAGEEDAARRVFQKVLKEVVHEEGKNFLLIPQIEGASIMKAAKELEERGCVIQKLSVDSNGVLLPETIERYASPKAGFLALSWIHPLTGVIQPIWEIAEVCARKGIKLYVQAGDMIGKLFFRLSEFPIDFLSFGGEKIGAPASMGALFTKGTLQESKIDPMILIPLAIAVKEAFDYMDAVCTEVAYLRHTFESALKEAFPQIVFIAEGAEKLPNTTAFAIPGLHAELLAYRLHQRGVALSYGGGDSQTFARVLEAMGQPPILAESAVSARFSLEIKESDMEKAREIVIEEIKSLLPLIPEMEAVR